MTIGAALDSLILLLEIAIVMTIVAIALVIWRGLLSGHLRKSIFWRKPLLLPSLVFVITLFVAMTYVQHPMSAYHGSNQLNSTTPYSGSFRVYGPEAYESNVQIRVARSLEPSERMEINATFSLEGENAGSTFMNITEEDLDFNGGVTRRISLAPGLYHLEVNLAFFDEGGQQDGFYVRFLANQAVNSEFVPELVQWSTYRFTLFFVCFFFVLGGICIDRGDPRKERKWDDKKDGERFVKSHTRWRMLNPS